MESTVGRRLMHMRRIEMHAYARDDGLWDVEARLLDEKPFSYIDPGRGAQRAGDPDAPRGGSNAEHYTPGSLAGGRPGWFEANVNDLKTRPKWTMETLLLHEAEPGHHLQISRAQELKQLPTFRR